MDLLSPKKIEPIILKLFYSDPKYCTMLGTVFEAGWFDSFELATSINLTAQYHQKFGKLPTYETLKLFVGRYFEQHQSPKMKERAKEALIKLEQAEGIDLSEYDREFIEIETLKYLKNGGVYWTFQSNWEEVQTTGNALSVIEKLSFLSNMNFDVDLGFDYLENIAQHCENLQEDELRLPTGWDNLDYATNGGLLAEGRCLMVFMGQTHIGKSLILSNMACNMIKNNKFVLLITLEMSEHVYSTRIDAHLSKLNINNLKHNTDDLLNSVSDIKHKNDEAKLIIKEFPPDSINCGHIKNYINKLITVTGRTPDAVFIDYINLLQPESPMGDNTYNKYRTVATEMRRLSYEFNCPMISVTQSNRAGHGSTDPGLDDTSDSYAIPMIADFVGGLFQNEGDKDLGRLNCAILKNRLGGQIGKILEFAISYENLTICDIKVQRQAPESIVNDVISTIGELNGV